MLKERKKEVYTALIIIIAIAIFVAAYLTFFYNPRCENYECWQGRMSRCAVGSTFINDEPEATWKYEIEDSTNRQCIVSVELLVAKEGELGIDKLAEMEMKCSYPLGISAYAERDLGKCHGLLKEELQTLIINKLHSYIIENLGQIEEVLESAI